MYVLPTVDVLLPNYVLKLCAILIIFNWFYYPLIHPLFKIKLQIDNTL